jgi:hypothetical protein
MTTLIDDLMARMPEKDYEPRLPKHAKEEFWENGFFTLKRITTDEEIVWLQEVYDALFRGETGAFVVRDVHARINEQRGDLTSQIIKPEATLPTLKRTQFWRNSRRLASQLLGIGKKEMDGWGHMVRKAAGDHESIAWHQDESYWDPSFDYLGLGVWMPLDAATEQSGAMRMIPGSHKKGLRTHVMANDDPAVTGGVTCPGVDESDAVLRPVPAGGASFHHCLTLHASAGNRTDRPRRAYVNEWQAIPVKREAPKEMPWYWQREHAMLAALRSARAAAH